MHYLLGRFCSGFRCLWPLCYVWHIICLLCVKSLIVCYSSLPNVSAVLSRSPPRVIKLFGGRRILDISLLTFRPGAILFENDTVILQPRYGSKTDSATRLLSPLTFVNGPDDMFSIPLLLKRYLDISAPVRKLCTDLFVSPLDPSSPASVQKFRSWANSLLVICGVEDTPAPTRAAVATISFRRVSHLIL